MAISHAYLCAAWQPPKMCIISQVPIYGGYVIKVHSTPFEDSMKVNTIS